MNCCGHPERRRRGPLAPLPKNPAVVDGVRVVYLGTERISVVGSASGLTYVADPRRREFTVHADDVRALVRQRDFIRAPT